MQITNIRTSSLLAFYALTLIFAWIAVNAWLNNLTPESSLISKDGQYVGRDFLLFYAAAKQVISGNISGLYSDSGIYNAMQTIVPDAKPTEISSWPWPYPPHYFLLLVPFALLPYYYALAAWTLLSLLLPSLTLWHFWRVRGLLFFAAILNINVMICLVMGQNALIFSSLVGIGIASLKKQPLLSGLCFAIVSMKPHFALLLPLALLLGRYWLALLYTIFATLLLMLATSLAFGWDVWGVALAHFGSVSDISFSNNIILFSIYSTYRAMLTIGFAPTYAWVAHFIVATLALYGLQAVWQGNYTLINKWLAFGIAALLFSPFSFAYDAVWITLPAMVYGARVIIENQNRTLALWCLLLLQLFAFAVISISHSLSILIIIGALLLLFTHLTQLNWQRLKLWKRKIPSPSGRGLG